jgi:predicted acylesterase/phospholipase RssA
MRDDASCPEGQVDGGAPRDLAITFAGGGSRSFYQVGLLDRWGSRLRSRLVAVAGVSAGACTAAVWLAGRTEATREYWHWRRRDVHSNFEWRRLLRGQRPTPQGPVYRDSMVHAFREGGLEALRACEVPVLMVVAEPPRRISPLASMVIGYGAYMAEKRLRPGMLHPSVGRRIGFVPRVFDARRCESAEEVADLILASSSTPPFTPFGSFRGGRYLDGGMVDNVPAFAAEQVPGVARNLVLLTRPYPPRRASGARGTRLYVAPSQITPVSCWDYTSSERVEATLAMGRAEATLHEAQLEHFLGCSPGQLKRAGSR